MKDGNDDEDVAIQPIAQEKSIPAKSHRRVAVRSVDEW